MKLQMDLYADFKYKIMYNIKNDTIDDIFYINENKEQIFTLNEGISNKIHYINGEDKKDYKSFIISRNKDDLIYHDFSKVPVIRNYRNSITKTEDTFVVHFDLDGNDISLEFDKQFIISFEPAFNRCIVYAADNEIINVKDKIEQYIFIKNGYLHEDFINDTIDFNNYNGEKIDMSFLKLESDLNIDILDTIIDKIHYNKSNNIFNIGYDENNIVYICSDNNPNMEYCRYEKICKEDNSEIIYSIHPLLIDLFDFEYIDEPFKYWCIDELYSENSRKSFTRKVYQIKDTLSLEQLLNIINTDTLTNSIFV